MRATAEREIDWRYGRALARHALEQWGLWCRTRTPGPKPDRSWMGPFVDRMLGSIIRSGAVQDWKEDDCERFDSQVMRKIRALNVDVFHALERYYAYPDREMRESASKGALAKRLRVNRDTASKRLEIGEHMVMMMMGSDE